MTITPTQGQKSPKPPEDEFHYPSGDGKPMAENDVCREQAIYCTDTLGQRYAHDPMVYVAGNNFIYYQEGNPKKVISPDVYVVFGVEKRLRKSYMAWNENGILPAVVFEITSASTWPEDSRKRSLYEEMGVTEYFQFDPVADYLYPPLQGFRLLDGYYKPIPLEANPMLRRDFGQQETANGSTSLCLRSEVLGLYLVQEGDWMRFYDAATGEPLLSARERADAEGQARASAERRAEAEAEARMQLEAEVARLRAELEELRHRQGT